jgi:hypothetical protein
VIRKLISAFEKLPTGHFLKALTITQTELGEFRITICNSRLHSGSVVGDSIDDCADQLLAVYGEALVKPEAPTPVEAKPFRRKLF